MIIFINDGKTIYNSLDKNENLSNYLVGLCIIDGCSIEDYKNIILKAMNKFNIIKDTENNNIKNSSSNDLKLTTDDIIIEIYSFNENENNDSNKFILFLQYLPVIIIILHIIFELFNFIPIFLCDLFLFIFCCRTMKKNSINSRSNTIMKMENLGKQGINPIDSEKDLPDLDILSNADIFHKSIEILYGGINQNFSSLTINKKQSKIIHSSGLSYINGLKGIAMIFYLFGCVYTCLYSSFITEKNKSNFLCSLKNILFSIFYIGIKYAPKILLCTSGLSLFFKFMNFLDGKVEKEEEILKQKVEDFFNSDDSQDKKSLRSSSIGDSNLNSFYKKLKKSGKVDKIDANNLLSFNSVLTFFIMQLNKYIIYILFMNFFIFSFNKIVILIQNPKTIWPFFNDSKVNTAKKIWYILPLLIGYKSYFIPGLSNSDENILDYLYLVFEEIIYFIVTTLILFIGYKKNLRIDRFFKVIFLILLIFRFVFVFFSKKDCKNYFGFDNFGKFYNSMIYNYIYHIIGILFGMIYYVIIKDFSYREIERQNKFYLLLSLRIYKTIKRKGKKFFLAMLLIIIILLIVCSFLQQIVVLFNEIVKSQNIFSDNLFIKIVFLLDADIFVIALNLMVLFFYIKLYNNTIYNILFHDFWNTFNRLYFSYILLINPIILYIIHVNETKIIFNLSNCFLYSFICGITVFSLSYFINIIFELPFKLIIQFWIKLKENIVVKKKLTHYEDDYSNDQTQNLLDNETVNITDLMDDEGEEDEEII
jgi:hypothetical protein